MALLVEKEFSLKETGHSVEVPNDYFAKLMYYLSCVSSCLKDVVPPEFTTYSNYRRLDQETRKGVVVLCALLSPDELTGKVIFPVPGEHPMLKGSSNKFYEMKEGTRLIGAAVSGNQAVLIEGRQVRIEKIMVFSQRWLVNYYLEPILGAIEILENPPRKALPPPAQKVAPRVVSTQPRSVPIQAKPAPVRTSPATLSQKNPDEWMPKMLADECKGCQKEFSVLRWKHHCRYCGFVYCDSCCPKFSTFSDTRICKPCKKENASRYLR